MMKHYSCAEKLQTLYFLYNLQTEKKLGSMGYIAPPLPELEENHRSKFCCQDKLHRMYLSLYFPLISPLIPPSRWLDFTKIFLLSPYLEHLEKKILGYRTDVDKLLQKCCLNIWILIIFYICVLYQHVTGHLLCTRVTSGDFSEMQICLS